ncbi:MAG: BACON domain-containing protein [Bacteroidales bacterium]|nr:BACON domain-containing protein [Bacteroidales bacterium]
MNKKLLYILAIALGALAFTTTSCEDSDDFNYLISKYYLKADTSVEIGGDYGSTAELNISSDCEWTISSNVSWLNLSATSGNGDAVITLTVNTANSSGDKDTATLTVTMKDDTQIKQSVTVTRTAGESTISVSPQTVEFSCVGGTIEIAITCNDSWEITGATSWLTLSNASDKGNATIELTAANYEDKDNDRYATLTVKNTTTQGIKEISVTQKKYTPTLTVTQSEFNFTADGGSAQFVLACSDAWEIVGIPDDAWFTISPSSATKGGSVPVTIEVTPNTTANSRSCILVAQHSVDSTLDQVITITQEAPGYALTLVAPSDGKIEFPATGGEQDIIIEATHKPVVNLSSTDWFRCELKSGPVSNLYTYTVSASANLTQNTQTVSISFSLEEAPAQSARVDVEQKATEQYLNVGNEEQYIFDELGGQATVSVAAYALWNATTDSSWIHLDVTTSQLTFTVDPNTDTSPRDAEITVYVVENPEKSVTFKVHQYEGTRPVISIELVSVEKNSITVYYRFDSVQPVDDAGIHISTDPDFATNVWGTQFVHNDGFTSFDTQYEFTDLEAGQTYYVVGYAVNSVDAYTSNILTVTTGGSIPNEDDNNPPSVD